MPHTSRFVGGLLLVVSAVLAPDDAAACSCKHSGPACQAFWTSDAVFDATVTSIHEATVPRSSGPVLHERMRRVTFQVHQGWKGVQGDTVEAVTALDEAGCGYSFEHGRRYLVFGRRVPSGHLDVSRCSATRRFDAFGDDIRFLESLGRASAGGRIFGRVRMSRGRFETGEAKIERRGELEIRLQGEGAARTVRSTGGRYEFRGLAPGTYHLSLTPPPGYTGAGTVRTVEIPDARACAQEDFATVPDGGISGTVVDASGRPVRGVYVGATTESDPFPQCAERTATTEPNGRFEFRALPPGRYVLVVNVQDVLRRTLPYPRTVYEGPASEGGAIDLDVGEKVDAGVWTLQPAVPRMRIRGTLSRPDGRPVTPATVLMMESSSSRPGGVASGPVDSQGRFDFEGFVGRAYTFLVFLPGDRKVAIPVPPAIAQEGMAPLQLTLPDDGR